MESFGVRLHRALAERGRSASASTRIRDCWRVGARRRHSGLDRFVGSVTEARLTGRGVQASVGLFRTVRVPRCGSSRVNYPTVTEAGSLVLLDVKRGDIGSTVAAYASAYLDPSSPLYVDAVTASPYLGVGSLAPMFELAARNGGGVFVLALTSNPEGAAVQRARTADGRTVAQTVIDEIPS